MKISREAKVLVETRYLDTKQTEKEAHHTIDNKMFVPSVVYDKNVHGRVSFRPNTETEVDITFELDNATLTYNEDCRYYYTFFETKRYVCEVNIYEDKNEVDFYIWTDKGEFEDGQDANWSFSNKNESVQIVLG